MFLIFSSVVLSLLIVAFGVTQGRRLFGAYDETSRRVHGFAEKLASCAEGISFKEVLQGWVKAEDATVRSVAQSLARLFDKEPLRLHGRIGWVVDLDDLCDAKRQFRGHRSFGKAEAMPGILTGIGILFTFLGLTIGVFGLDPTNADQLTLGVKKLLGGMSLAFLTSIAGIGTALWWTWTAKAVNWRFESAFVSLSEMLHGKAFLLIPDEMNYQILDFQAAQSKALGEMEETVYRAFNKALNQSGIQELRLLRSDNQKYAQVLDDIQKGLALMSEGIAESTEINRMVARLIEKNANEPRALADGQVSLDHHVKLVADTQKVLANLGQVNHVQAGTVKTIADAGEELKKLIKASRIANADIVKNHREMLNHMANLDEHWNVYREEIKTMQDILNKSLGGFQGVINQALKKVHGEFDGLLAKSLKHFTEAMKEFEGTLEGLAMLTQSEQSGAKKKAWLGKR